MIKAEMTKVEAIGWIHALVKTMHDETSGTCPEPEYKDEVYCALDMATKALLQEPCDDVISRILARMWNCRGKHTTSIDKVKMEQILREELLSVTQKTGKWQKYNGLSKLSTEDVVICNQCAFVTYKDSYYKYCPNCGAKMQTESEYKG